LVCIKMDAWLAEKRTAAQLRLDESERRLMHSRAGVLREVLAAREQLAAEATRVEEAEAELQAQRRLRGVDRGVLREVLGDEAERERLLLERELLRRHRFAGTLPPAVRPAPEPPVRLLPAAVDDEDTGQLDRPSANTEPFEVDITDRQIETLALRAVVRFAKLSGREAEDGWAAWRRELRRRLPAFTADEVASRADELRRMVNRDRRGVE